MQIHKKQLQIKENIKEKSFDYYARVLGGKSINQYSLNKHGSNSSLLHKYSIFFLQINLFANRMERENKVMNFTTQDYICGHFRYKLPISR